MNQNNITLETERLLLRPYRLTDLEDAIRVMGDAETMCFYPEPFSEEKIRAMIERQIHTFADHGYGLFAVFEKSSGRFIGDCGITVQNIDGVEELEIGYRFAKETWGKGYAPEAAQAVKQYGLNTLKLKRLCSYMGSDHLQSRRVAEKIGMQLEKEYLNPNNRNLPTVVYAVVSYGKTKASP